jgi:hypothetical protein
MRKAISRVPASLLIIVLTACCSSQSGNTNPPPPPMATGGHTDTACDHQPHDNVMKVDHGVASCDSVEVSMSEQNFVMWHANKTETLTIAWKTVKPFEHVDCFAHVCIAFGIVQGPGTYDYSLSVNGQAAADPNIIIKP